MPIQNHATQQSFFLDMAPEGLHEFVTKLQYVDVGIVPVNLSACMGPSQPLSNQVASGKTILVFGRRTTPAKFLKAG
jgi:hypothetical protein